MKKLLNFLWMLVLTLVLSLGLGANQKIQASKLSDKAELVEKLIEKDVYGNAMLYKQKMKTLYDGITDPSSSKYKWNPHTVQWVDFDPTENVKVVTYSGSAKDAWKQMTTRQVAKDYEATHPGWIVLAGINGDFFKNTVTDGRPATHEPTGNFMQDGDMYRAEKAGASYRNTIGFKQEGGYIIGDPSISTSMYVRKYNEGKDEIIEELKISAYNKAPSSSGITLITKDATSTYDLTGYKVYVGSYDVCRVSIGGMPFVKGTIEEIKEDLGKDSKPDTGKFYLVTKDNSLNSINVNDYLKCEFVYENEWKSVSSSIGYVYQVLEDGNPLYEGNTDNDFIYTTHPRTLIGFKENGEMVFMVVAGRGKESDYEIGASLPQCGELLRLAGCTEGYNLDGGGSSTLIVRNEYGNFDVVNKPSDGSERSDGNHCLVVMRDPGFSFDSSESTYNTANIKLNVKNEELFKNLKNIKITLNNETKDYTSSVTFTNLEKQTTYPVTITYDNLDVYDPTKVTTQTYKTYLTTPDYDYPDPGLSAKGISKTSIKITKDMNNDKASWIKDVIVHIGNTTYTLGNEESLIINDLIANTEYSIYFTYNIYDPSGDILSASTEAITVKTLSYDLPEIKEFKESKKKENSLSVSYEYVDNDNLVEKAYILINGKEKELSSMLGSERFSDLDFTKNVYELTLVLEGHTKEGESFKITSEVLKYDEVKDEKPQEKKKKCGKKSAELIISFLAATSLMGIVLRKKK